MKRFELIREGPYRLFFPLGILAGLLGVGHWMLWSVGWIARSDPFFHAMIQTEGFLTSFVAGFLMTAVPRFLGAEPATIPEVFVSAGLEVGVIMSLLERIYTATTVLFLLLLLSLVTFGVRRFRKRTKLPPPSFMFVGFGLLQAFLGSVFLLLQAYGKASYALMEAGRQMLQLGFLLSMVLGVGGYLAPFFMGYAADPSCSPKAGDGPACDSRLRLLHGLGGLMIAVSFFGVSVRWAQVGAIARACVAAGVFLLYSKITRAVRIKKPHVYLFVLSCWMVLAGLVVNAIWPDYRMAGLHLIFIGGFSLMIFAFGLLVILSHGEDGGLLATRLIPLQVIGALVVIAAGMRVMAELDVERYRGWIHSASGAWVLAGAGWLIYIFPKLFRASHSVDGNPSYRRSS